MLDITPIRILHVIGIMNRGGAESMIMNLYRNIDREKIQFDFVVHTEEKAAFDDEIVQLGGKIFHCPKLRGKNYFTYTKWWNDFFKKDGEVYGIVHGHIGSTAAIYLGIAKKYGKYAIAHSHSSGTDYSLKKLLYDIISYNTRYIADYFFACSEAAGKDRFGVRVTNNKQNYSVINNAIDTRNFAYNEKNRIEMRNELGLSDEELVVGHVGRFTSEKNHEFILDIFRQLLCKRNNVKLILIGDGPLRKDIERKALEHNIMNNILFMGVRSDVNKLMQAMDILVFPSIYEGLPVTLVEAQTSGLPCLISSAIPNECILTSNVVTVCSLDESAAVWADKLQTLFSTERVDHSDEIKQNNYDINATAKWLEEFYLEKWTK